MSPMTAAEAVSAGLITGARWRHDAMNFIMHFPDTQQPSIMYNMAVDQSAWPAAGVNGTGYVGDLVAKAQAFAEAEGQLHNGVRADGRSLLGGVFHPWRCFIHHFCGRTGVVQTDLTYFVRMSDYIANMQHAAGAEPHMAAKPKATEALSAAKAKANESYSAVKARAGAASGEAGGAAEEAKKSHASPLTSGLMTMAASPDMANKPRVEVITASGTCGLSQLAHMHLQRYEPNTSKIMHERCVFIPAHQPLFCRWALAQLSCRHMDGNMSK